MNYLFYGDDIYTIDNEIKKIIEDEKINPLNISNYDYSIDGINKILEDAMTISLFQDKKCIIVSNATLFEGSSEQVDLTNYLNNYNNNTILIFKTGKVSNNKIYKKIKEVGMVYNYNTASDINKKIIGLFAPYKIKNEDINFLLERINGGVYNEKKEIFKNIYDIKNEIDKLKIYKGEDYNIKKEDIINVVSENTPYDFDKLTASIIENNKDEALEIYNSLSKKNDSLIILLGVAKKIRLMYQVKELQSTYDNNKIGEILNINPKYVYYLKKDAALYKSRTLLKYIKLFADIDYKTKIGEIDINKWLQLFILTK